MKKTFRSIYEIEKIYFPRWYRRKQKEKKFFGEKLANKLIAKLKKELKKINQEV